MGSARARTAAALFATALAVYGNSLRSPFTFDDKVAVRDNLVVRGNVPWREAFRRDFWGQELSGEGWTHKSFRPLTTLSFRLDRALWGHEGDLLPQHAVNAALHGAVSVLVHETAAQFGVAPRTRAVAAMLFAVHPVHVECVSNLTGRAELLAAALALAAFLVFASHCRAAARPRRALGALRIVGVGLLAAASMLCKETGVMILPVCAIWHAIEGAQWRGVQAVKARRAQGAAPWPARLDAVAALLLDLRESALRLLSPATGGAAIALFAGISACRVRFTGGTAFHMHQSFNTLVGLPRLWQRALFAAFLQASSAALMVWPDLVGMAHTHGAIEPVRAVRDPRNALSAALYGGVLLAVLGSLARRSARDPATARAARSRLAALAWVLVCYAPASHAFFPVGFLLAERALYAPSVGACILLAMAAEDAGSLLEAATRARGGGRRRAGVRRALAVAVAASLAAAYGLRTWRRNGDWRSERAVRQATLRVYPDCVQSLHGVAYEDWLDFRRRGGADRAARFLRGDGTLDWDGFESGGEGRELADLARSARRALARAIAVDPAFSPAAAQLAKLEMVLGEWRACEAHAVQAVNSGSREAGMTASICAIRRGDAPRRARRGFFVALDHSLPASFTDTFRALNNAGVAAVHPAFYDDAIDAPERLYGREPARPDPALAVELLREAVVLCRAWRAGSATEEDGTYARNLARAALHAGDLVQARWALDATRAICGELAAAPGGAADARACDGALARLEAEMTRPEAVDLALLSLVSA